MRAIKPLEDPKSPGKYEDRGDPVLVIASQLVDTH